MNRKIGAFIALGIVVTANTAWPHHNMTALFDLNDRVTFTGAFTKLDWRNPHNQFSWREERWRDKWSLGPWKDRRRAEPAISAKAILRGASGKTVTVEVSRARDGLLRVLTLRDGKVMSASP